MPKGSKGSDDDFEFKRKNEDFGFDADVRGKDLLIKWRKKVKVIFTNVEIHLAENSITPTLHFITIARNHTMENFLRTLCTMEKFLKVPLRIEEDLELKKIKPRTKHR